MSEVYCDQCYGIRHGDMTATEWDLHLMDEDKISQYRQRNFSDDNGMLQQSIFKVAKRMRQKVMISEDDVGFL